VLLAVKYMNKSVKLLIFVFVRIILYLSWHRAINKVVELLIMPFGFVLFVKVRC